MERGPAKLKAKVSPSNNRRGQAVIKLRDGNCTIRSTKTTEN